MHNILILGGTRDALLIAKFCQTFCNSQPEKHNMGVIYSIAGVARNPAVECELRVGGFGGWQGLRDYLTRNDVVLLIDASHPYASGIRANALQASTQANIPMYRYTRPVWQQTSKDKWQLIESMDLLLQSVTGFKRPLFTIGRSALTLLVSKRQTPFQNQHWTIRYIQTPQQQVPECGSDVTLISDIGPFSYETELQLLKTNKIDVLIAKNSGGEAVSAKIAAARQLALPVLMLKRPESRAVQWQFNSLPTLEVELNTFIKNYQSLPDLIV